MASAGMRSMHRREFSQGNLLLPGNSEVLPSRGYSGTSKRRGMVGIALQKCSEWLTSMFISSGTSINTTEKTKMPLTVPDICVDININTPIFEAIQGQIKLTIPQDESTCDEIKSVLQVPAEKNSQNSVENSSDYCSSYDGHGMVKSKKRQDAVAQEKYHLSIVKPGCSVTKKSHSWTPVRLYNKSKSCNKNRREKDRHNLQINIMEDMWQITDDQELDSDNMECQSNQTFSGSPSISSISSKNSSIDLSETAFPSITSMLKDVNCPEERSSEDSEESFVMLFDMTNPVARIDVCSTSSKIPSAFANQRRRQLSECSDDSIVFCYESDGKDSIHQPDYDYDDEDDSEEEEDTDEESCDEDSESTLSHQPDSGFEEKKVQFNLKPEVHVMRAWDFAYRQARKGEWEMAARDRERFKKRIKETEVVLSKAFDKHLRDKVYKERFCC